MRPLELAYSAITRHSEAMAGWLGRALRAMDLVGPPQTQMRRYQRGLSSPQAEWVRKRARAARARVDEDYEAARRHLLAEAHEQADLVRNAARVALNETEESENLVIRGVSPHIAEATVFLDACEDAMARIDVPPNKIVVVQRAVDDARAKLEQLLTDISKNVYDEVDKADDAVADRRGLQDERTESGVQRYTRMVPELQQVASIREAVIHELDVVDREAFGAGWNLTWPEALGLDRRIFNAMKQFDKAVASLAALDPAKLPAMEDVHVFFPDARQVVDYVGAPVPSLRARGMASAATFDERWPQIVDAMYYEIAGVFTRRDSERPVEGVKALLEAYGATTPVRSDAASPEPLSPELRRHAADLGFLD
jgi:hypothetical protein